jgi:hypothetical protein
MANDPKAAEAPEAPPRKMVQVRLKKKIIETPVKKTVNINGEDFKLSSESVTEVPDFVLPHLGVEYELEAEAATETEETPRSRRHR